MTTISANLVNPGQLSEMTGVQLNTVYAWRKRRATNGMPEPDLVIGRTPQWDRDKITLWLKATNRLK